MTPKDLLDNFDKLVHQLALSHLCEIQSGALGDPTMDDLSRCGRLHALLESGGMLTRESLQNPVKPKETAQEVVPSWRWSHNLDQWVEVPPPNDELTRRQSQLISELEKNRKLTEENHRLREAQPAYNYQFPA